jgi:hypothetical protein
VASPSGAQGAQPPPLTRRLPSPPNRFSLSVVVAIAVLVAAHPPLNPPSPSATLIATAGAPRHPPSHSAVINGGSGGGFSFSNPATFTARFGDDDVTLTLAGKIAKSPFWRGRTSKRRRYREQP